MARDGRREALPGSAYGVLGILTFGLEWDFEPSGYDVAKTIDQTIGFFYTPAKSQVYAHLRRIVEAGFATEREVEQESRPDKKVYRVTPEGVEAFRAWLSVTPVELEPIESTFLLKVFFSHLLPPDEVLAMVESYRKLSVDLLARYREIEGEALEHPESLPGPYLTLKYGIAYVQAAIEWCDAALKELNGRTKQERPNEGRKR